MPKKKEIKKVSKKKKSDCPDCGFKRGLKDDDTICPTCEGSGLV